MTNLVKKLAVLALGGPNGPDEETFVAGPFSTKEEAEEALKAQAEELTCPLEVGEWWFPA